MSESEKRMLGITPSTRQDDVLRQGAVKALAEDAIATSQQHVPLGSVRSADRKDMRPWQGKESDGEIMFNFESAMDAQDLYDFVLETGLVTPGEVKLYMSEHQTSVHFAPSVLVQKPEIIQMALISYHEQATEESLEAMDNLVEDVNAVLAEKVASNRASGEPKTNIKFNPFHDKSGQFTSRDGVKPGGSWSDGAKKGSRKLKATKKGKKLHFAATKLPCGRSARDVSRDIRCWDGLGAKLAKAKKKLARDSSPRLMPGVKEGFSREDIAAINECLAMYGSKKRLSEGKVRPLRDRYMVAKSKGGKTLYWNGRGWSDEYPDGWIYDTEAEADRAAAKSDGGKVIIADSED
jgi:hypothetical protein